MEKGEAATHGTGSAARHGGQTVASKTSLPPKKNSGEGRQLVLPAQQRPQHLLPQSKGLNPDTSFPPLCLQAQNQSLLTPPPSKASLGTTCQQRSGREKAGIQILPSTPSQKKMQFGTAPSTAAEGTPGGGTGCSVVQPSWSQVSNSLLPTPSSAACRSPATHPQGSGQG